MSMRLVSVVQSPADVGEVSVALVHSEGEHRQNLAGSVQCPVPTASLSLVAIADKTAPTVAASK